MNQLIPATISPLAKGSAIRSIRKFEGLCGRRYYGPKIVKKIPYGQFPFLIGAHKLGKDLKRGNDICQHDDFANMQAGERSKMACNWSATTSEEHAAVSVASVGQLQPTPVAIKFV
ncbi:MAG: hypothetical protein ACRER2_14885 [Methylococcales bacterium]